MPLRTEDTVDLGDDAGGIQMRTLPRGRKVVRLSSKAEEMSPASDRQLSEQHGSTPADVSDRLQPAGADGLIEQDVQQAESDDTGATQVDPEQSGTVSKSGPSQTVPKQSSAAQSAPPPMPPPTRVQAAWQRVLSARQVAWIAPKATSFDAWKPVLRSSASAWLGLVVIVIRPAEVILGQAAFFALVVAFICPPSSSFIQTVEMNFYLFFYVGLSWAWCVLAAFIADKTRTNQVNAALLEQNENRFAGLKATNPEQYNRALVRTSKHGFPRITPLLMCVDTRSFRERTYKPSRRSCASSFSASPWLFS